MIRITTTLFSIILTSIAFGQYNFNEIEVWSGNIGSSPRYFAEVNGEMYFQAKFDYTTEIWKTDGTQIGTSMVVDLNGAFSSAPADLQAYNGGLLFTAGESGFGTEPYFSDGTSGGTFRLADVRPGPSAGMQGSVSSGNGDRETFIEFGGEMFFFGTTGNGRELWKTDGTVIGTFSVKNFNDAVFGIGKWNLYGNLEENMGVIYNNELYFIVSRGSNDEIWKTDGTTVGTVLVRDGLTAIREMFVFNNEIYFSAAVGVTGEELWTSDGTTVGTNLKFDIDPGTSSSRPRNLTIYNGELYFSAWDGTTQPRKRLFKTDGTTLTLVVDVNVAIGTFGPNWGVGGVRYTEYNGLLYFSAVDDLLTEVWRTDGTQIGTELVVTSAQSAGEYLQLRHPVIYTNKLFFESNGQLWVTDGTGVGTEKITDNGNLAEPISQVRQPHLFQNKLWFAGANDLNGSELWYIGDAPPTPVYANECTSYTVPSGDETYITTGVYYDTIPSSLGADSILQIDVTISGASYATINESTCDSYISPSGNYSWDYTGTFYDTIAGTNTCDSIITVNLTLMVVDTSVTDLGGTLQSNSSTSTYQWLDCNNGNAIISGEIGETFTPTQTGVYAVQVTEPGGCSDTSACHAITVLGIKELENQSVLVYPNPTTSKVNVLLKGNDQAVSVIVKDATGRNVAQFQGQGEHLLFDLEESSGIYFLEIKIDANLVQRIRVIKE